MGKIKLFCFPYAGGSAAIYNKWKQYLDPDIELVPVELAGRGKRMYEPLYKDIAAVTEDVLQVIKREINNGPYALFGHSMGGMIVHELAQKIRANAMMQPLHLFFSGRGAPSVERKDKKKYHLMNDHDFKKELLLLGGTPPEFFEHPEVVEIFLPVLRNDFMLSETSFREEKIQPLDRDITVFLGKEEDLTPEQCNAWKNHTTQLCKLHYFEGGHFFLHDETAQIVKLINHTLRSARKAYLV